MNLSDNESTMSFNELFDALDRLLRENGLDGDAPVLMHSDEYGYRSVTLGPDGVRFESDVYMLEGLYAIKPQVVYEGPALVIGY